MLSMKYLFNFTLSGLFWKCIQTIMHVLVVCVEKPFTACGMDCHFHLCLLMGYYLLLVCYIHTLSVCFLTYFYCLAQASLQLFILFCLRLIGVGLQTCSTTPPSHRISWCGIFESCPGHKDIKAFLYSSFCLP